MPGFRSTDPIIKPNTEGREMDRAGLKKDAHRLKPVVMIGHKGLTETVINAVDRALEDHELIKVRFIDFKEERRELADDLSRKTGSEIVEIIGNVLVLYRKNMDDR